MGFPQGHPERIAAVRAYCDLLQDVPDPLMKLLNALPSDHDRIAWCIAASAMHQGITLHDLARVVKELVATFPGNECWSIPAPRSSAIIAAVHRVPGMKGWPLEEHVPGILLSVGLWLRQAGTSPLARLQASSTVQLWHELGQIHYLGRTSVVRPKVLALISRLRQAPPVGLGIGISERPLRSGRKWPFPVSSGVRRWLRLLGPDRRAWLESHSEAERLQYFQKMFAGLCPGDPFRIAHGLSFFLEPEGQGLACRTALSGCALCPMLDVCPGKRI